MFRNLPKFRIIPPLIHSWLAVSAFLISVLGTGALYRSDGANPGDYVLLLTLVVLIFYTYYTYILAVISAKGPALLEVQKEHTKDLKEFLIYWQSTLKYRRNFDRDFSTDPKQYFDTNKNLERDWRYVDFTDHHIPYKYKEEFDLKMCWEDYKNDRNLLESKSYNLYKKIYGDVRLALAIEDDVHLNTITKDIYELFFNINCEKKCRKPKVEMARGQFELSYYSVPDLDLMVSTIIRTNKHPEQAMSDFNKMISNDNIKKYKSCVNEIGQIASNLQDNENRLKEAINELIKWPLFPGTSCDVLKDFDLTKAN